MTIIFHALAEEGELNDYWGPEGMPTVRHFGNALQVWSIAQGHYCTVQDAATAFNVTPELIREAVNAHAWMLIGAGDLIEHDGE